MTAAVRQAAASAPTSTALQQSLAALKVRRRELDTKRAQVSQELAEARTRRGALLAAGSGAGELKARIAELTDDDDGYTRAVAVLDGQIATAQKQFAAAVVDEATSALKAVDCRRAAALEQLDAVVRQIVADQVTPLVDALAAIDSERATAWRLKAHALQQAGRSMPGGDDPLPDREWRRFPDLRPAVTLLTQYVAGESPKQKDLQYHETLRRANADAFANLRRS